MLGDRASSNMPEGSYAEALERRIAELEEKVQKLDSQVTRQQNDISSLRALLPDTALLNQSFLTRAFAVFGHSLVAQLLIAIPFYCLMFILAGLGQ